MEIMTTSEFDSYLTKNYPRTSSFLSGLALFFVDALVLILCIEIKKQNNYLISGLTL